jgi:hypothetical protein
MSFLSIFLKNYTTLQVMKKRIHLLHMVHTFVRGHPVVSAKYILATDDSAMSLEFINAAPCACIA